MREIKFRGKPETGYNYGKSWLYGSLVCLGENHYGIIEQDDITYTMSGMIDYSHTVINKETIGQFTGLLDKNGKEIYEGDILHGIYKDKAEPSGVGHTYNEVAFRKGAFGWIGEITGDFFPFDGSEIEEEVIGNIHDNPELLTDKKDDI